MAHPDPIRPVSAWQLFASVTHRHVPTWPTTTTGGWLLRRTRWPATRLWVDGPVPRCEKTTNTGVLVDGLPAERQLDETDDDGQARTVYREAIERQSMDHPSVRDRGND